MNENEPTLPTERFEQPTVTIAALACFLSLFFLFLVCKPLLAQSKADWLGLAVCASLPLLVTFTIFYCSSWKKELKGISRIASVLFRSFTIFIIELFVSGLTLCLVWLVFNALSGHGGHHG